MYGDIVIAGRKTYEKPQQQQIIELAGVIRPDHIGRDRHLWSYQIADLRVETRSCPLTKPVIK